MGIGVTENKTRKMIFNHITTHPGVSFSILKQVFGSTDSTLRYHLQYLESHNEIRSNLAGNNRCYYPNQSHIFNSQPNSEQIVHHLNSTQEILINVVKRCPGITQKELMIQTGLNRITIAHNIKKILDFGVMRKEPNGRNVCYYYLSDTELREKIMKRLITKLLNDEIDEKTFLALKHKLD